jgi:hypothetical protein
MKPYKITYLHNNALHTMFLFGLSKQSMRASVTKHWNEHLVFDAKIIRIDEVPEEELWRQYDNQTI